MDQSGFFSLAWTLAHSLWQAALVVALLYGLMAAGRNISSGTRYLMGGCAFTLVVVFGVYSFVYHYNAYRETVLWIQLGSMPPQAETGINLAGRYISRFSKDIALLWTLGFFLALVRYLGAVLYCRRLIHQAGNVLPDSVLALVKSTREQMQVRKNVTALLSKSLDTPCVIGHFKPVLLLPLAFINHIGRAELEVILLHEFAHIRRNDYLVGLVQYLLKTLYFFNPFVHLISRVIGRERENICDDLAVKCCGDACLFGRALEKMSLLSMTAGLAMAFQGDGHLILARIGGER